MQIRLLKRSEIDDAKWNGCVHYAMNSKIYAYTWYLDNVSYDWFGLVEEDYISVMPLIWNDKIFGLKQIYLPFLSQQLGIFSVNSCNLSRINNFLEALPKDFRYIQIPFNDGNKEICKVNDLKIETKQNFLLYLDQPYEELAQQYSSNTCRNISKAFKHQLKLSNHLKPETFIEAVKKAQLLKGIHHDEKLYHTGLRIIYNCLHRGMGSISAAFDQNNELCAAIFFMYNGPAIINLLNVSTSIGRNTGAMHYLIDVTIQKEANKKKYIDFEGSSIDSIAQFYQSFGAVNKPYYLFKKNDLPWWVKWWKK